MRTLLLLLGLAFVSTAAHGAQYKIGEFIPKPLDNYLEIGRVVAGGVSFGRMLDLTKPSGQSLTIRIMSPLTDEGKREVVKYFQDEIPRDLEAARKSKGSLHDPLIHPLIYRLADAVRTTTEYHVIEANLQKRGYRVVAVGFEKFTFGGGDPFIAEMWLECQRDI